MIRSMTGYGRNELVRDGWSVVWEVKSVNSRYLDLKWRTPHFLRGLETAWERTVREFAARGRLDLTLNIQVARADVLHVALNRPLAEAMLDEMSALAGRLNVAYTPDLNRLLTISALWQDSLAEPDPALAGDVDACLRAALANWNESRTAEGKAVAADILSRLGRINELVGELKGMIPPIVEDKLTQARERIKNLIESAGGELAPERIVQEAGLLADRLDVSEELTRLGIHLEALGKILNNGGESGKRLDFLLQETFREITTCGNKSQSATVSGLAVEVKTELEKCREQVQNIE